MKSLILIFAFILAPAGWASADENCPNAQQLGLRGTLMPDAYSVTDSMSEVLCHAAEDGRWRAPTDTLASQCGVGIKDGAGAFASGLAAMATNLKDVGIGGFEKAKRYVQKLWKSENDPALAAEKAAQENSAQARTWLQTVSTYYEASQALMQEFYKQTEFNIKLVGSTMACLPPKFFSQYACEALTQMALELASVKGVAVATNKAAATTKAVSEFVKRTNMIEGMKKLSFPQKIAAATKALEAQSQFRTVEKLGRAGNLVSRADPITGADTLYFEESGTAGGKSVTALRELPRDAKTLAIDANFETGKRVAKLTVEKAKGNHLIFIDVNNLGKVNYFKQGTQAGDVYLERVANSIRSNLRPEDRFFKNGGDELVVVLKTQNPDEVKAVIQRIHQSIENDSALQSVFKAERIEKAKKIKLTGAPPDTAQITALQDAARLRPSVSIGSTRIAGEWSTDLARAEKQAGEVKAMYKKALGSDASKYGGVTDEVGDKPKRFIAKPPVLDPAT